MVTVQLVSEVDPVPRGDNECDGCSTHLGANSSKTYKYQKLLGIQPYYLGTGSTGLYTKAPTCSNGSHSGKYQWKAYFGMACRAAVLSLLMFSECCKTLTSKPHFQSREEPSQGLRYDKYIGLCGQVIRSTRRLKPCSHDDRHPLSHPSSYGHCLVIHHYNGKGVVVWQVSSCLGVTVHSATPLWASLRNGSALSSVSPSLTCGLGTYLH
jgi:hypothetical protein